MFTYYDEQEFARLQARIGDRLKKNEATAHHPYKFARIVIDVELGLELMSRLHLEDEPITTVWVLLHGLLLRFEEDHLTSPEQRRALANARQLLSGYAGSFGWEEALRAYVNYVPREWRMYDFNSGALESQLLNQCRINTFEDRETFYAECLTSILPFKQRNREYAKADVEYTFKAEMPDENTQDVRVSIPAQYFTQQNLEQLPTYSTLFQQRERAGLHIYMDDLSRVATWLDERELALGIKRSKTWCGRLKDISLQMIVGKEKLQEADFLDLNGMFHLAGMVGSGKSTLMSLIAALFVIAQHEPARFQHAFKGAYPPRLTLVVGDSATSIQLADQFNRWFCHSPETDAPVATPLLGQSTRDNHLKQLHHSREYLRAVAEDRVHWGERFLNTACKLQAIVMQDQDKLPQPLTPGKEPCHGLYTEKKEQNKRSKRTYHLCPFFHDCPVQQRYLDIPHAQIWITTPGAFGSSSFPRHIEDRSIKVGDLVYEQSDLVIFDEVDTIIEWFDLLYARETKLADKGKGILDEIHAEMGRYRGENRRQQGPTRRWTDAQGDVQKPLENILNQLAVYEELLPKWLKRNRFTAQNLFYKIARRMAGLKEFEDSISPEQRLANERQVRPLLDVFEIITDGDPLESSADEASLPDDEFTLDDLLTLRQQLAASPQDQATRHEYEIGVKTVALRLKNIMRTTINLGDSTQNGIFLKPYKSWIITLIPDLDERLTVLKRTLQTSTRKADREYAETELDTLDLLAKRLEFAANATLLDRYTRIIFYEWHSRPNDVIADKDHPHHRIPSNLINILPLPPIGRAFGLYYWSEKKNDVLSSFGYTNMGRWLVMNFHQVRLDLEGIVGPNVLAMSGTSFLPHSTHWHFGGMLRNGTGIQGDTEPKGILNASDINLNAIKQSHFEFLPQYDRKDQPIRVSGSTDKEQPLKNLTTALIANRVLQNELTKLKRLGEENPALWLDRDRLLLLVNSYEQCEWVWQTIQHSQLIPGHQVFYLVPSAEDEMDEQEARLPNTGQIYRSDIESFGRDPERKILIAPLQSIGRGFNILNSADKAAFGAVYFLTRPLPHPYDIPAMAQELNRRLLDWYADDGFSAWQADGVYRKGLALRREASRYWTLMEERTYYQRLYALPEYQADPQQDIAATTAGTIIQAAGRLLRNGVPFNAYFVDAAWSPQTAEGGMDSEATSLLFKIIEVLDQYVAGSVIGKALYKVLSDRLQTIEFKGEPYYIHYLEEKYK